MFLAAPYRAGQTPSPWQRRLPITDRETGDLNAVIETPRGDRNKYDYDPEIGGLRLAKVLPEGAVFPYDFGFIPSTKAADGDPLDVMVLLDDPVPPGCVVAVRVIGAIAAEQRKNGTTKWLRNDRLIAVPTHAHLHGHIDSLKQLNPKMLDEIEAFFEQYNKLSGSEFRVLDRLGPKDARKLIEDMTVSS